MEQLVLELAAVEPPRLSNFLPGRNAEIIAALPAFVAGSKRQTPLQSTVLQSEVGLLLWGGAGSGKTHLLLAAHALAESEGYRALYHATPADVGADLVSQLPDVVLVDRIDEADADAAGRLFTVYNALKERGGRFVGASRTPPAAISVREDLRTRLGWGLVYELVPLGDEEKGEAMRAYARRRGFVLADEVIDYWLRHGRRDMPSLLRTLAALDRYSLSTKRPITVPLLRDWLQREADRAGLHSPGEAGQPGAGSDFTNDTGQDGAATEASPQAEARSA